jgi:ArsR family transcriptional regulator, arsenate/arsenite/antimonite-responsive transcriptional repressor
MNVSVKTNVKVPRAAARECNLEDLFRALADRTRLRLVNLMAGGEICVCFLVEALGISQPKVSRHLAYLRRAGVVAARRDGKWMHYRLVPPPDERAARVFQETLHWLTGEPAMRRDRERMVAMCCAPQMPIRLQGAPRPPIERLTVSDRLNP